MLRIKAQSEKLLQAHYAGGVPLSLMREEQARLIHEQAEAEHLLECTEVEQADYLRALDEALDLPADASQLYLAGTPAVRRQLNLAIFNKLCVPTRVRTSSRQS